MTEVGLQFSSLCTRTSAPFSEREKRKSGRPGRRALGGGFFRVVFFLRRGREKRRRGEKSSGVVVQHVYEARTRLADCYSILLPTPPAYDMHGAGSAFVVSLYWIPLE